MSWQLVPQSLTAWKGWIYNRFYPKESLVLPLDLFTRFDTPWDYVQILITSMRMDEKQFRDAPLPAVVRYNSIKLCKLLLCMGTDTEMKDSQGNTPLYIAACRGYWQVCKLLLIAGADVNSESSSQHTPLYGAACKGHIQVCKLFISAGANANAKDKADGKSINRYFRSAILDRDVESCKILLTAGADVDTIIFGDCTALNSAVSDGDYKMCELLVAMGADVNRDDDIGCSVLKSACIYNYANIVELLLAAGANMNATYSSCSLLELTVILGSLDALKVLLSAGINVNERDIDGYTALHLAHDADVVEVLLSAGADATILTSIGETALHLAAQRGSSDACKLLLTVPSADVNKQSHEGNTPLHYAARAGCYDTCELLVDALASIDILNNGNKMPSQVVPERDTTNKELYLYLKKLEDARAEQAGAFKRARVNYYGSLVETEGENDDKSYDDDDDDGDDCNDECDESTRLIEWV